MEEDEETNEHPVEAYRDGDVVTLRKPDMTQVGPTLTLSDARLLGAALVEVCQD